MSIGSGPQKNRENSAFLIIIVGVRGIEPRSLPPQGSGLPLSYTPDYFLLPIALMHLAQAFTLLPEAKRTHWRLGCFLFLMVGLYFPLSFFNFQTILPLLPQIAHCLGIYQHSIRVFYFFQVMLSY